MATWMQALAPYGIFFTDRALRIRSWNSWLETKSGRTAPEVLNRPLTEVYPDLVARHLDRHYARALLGEVIVLSTALHRHLLPIPTTVPDSPTPHMLQTVRIAPLLEGGQIVGTITVIEDVTQREVQAALISRQQQIEGLLSTALAILLQSHNPGSEMGGIISSIAPVLGLDSFLTYLPSAAGNELVLHASSGLSPKQRDSLATWPLTEKVRTALRTAGSAEAQLPELEAALVRLGARTHSLFPLLVGERLLGLVAFATYHRDVISQSDVAVLARVARYISLALDRSQRERETLAASRAKDDFLAALSHELRTPLNPVLLIASESEANPEFSAEARENFRVIEKNVLLEARLIDDLLDLTRIEHGKLALEMETIDLHTVIRDAIETVRADVARSALTMEVNLDASAHTVLGDAGRLQQVFWNVLKNAVKFTPSLGRIWVSTTSDPATQQLTVTIADTGIGMDEPELARVFGAFSQGDHSRPGGPHRFGGLGLGLAISRKLVESHRGRIDASSQGKNLGATFTIRLPLVAAALQRDDSQRRVEPPRPIAPPVAVAGQARGRILLVEDHEPSRLTLRHLLQRRGFEVTAAESATSALAAAAGASFDLVVSDIGLPDLSGNELMRKLRDDYGAIGVALTGYGMEDDLTRTSEAGFFAHLTKPINVDALDRVLAKVFPKLS